MNVENIKRVRDHIAGLPAARFTMDVWSRAIVGDQDTEPEDLIHNCNTAGCIAGWTIAILEPEKENGDDRYMDRAARALGLNYEQGRTLFINCNGQTNAEAVAVLDHLLETGEVDWSVAEWVA